MLYVMLGKAREKDFKAAARRLCERATKTKNHIGLGHHSMAFAIYHMNKLQPDDALIHAKKALAFFKKASDRDDVVSALAHIAIIQMSLGKPKPARTSLEQAEEIYEAIHCEYLKPLLMLAKAMFARLEHADDAKKILADALRVSKKMGTRETAWQIQREFALYHKDKGEPHKALAYYKDAIETIKQITETIDEEELRLSYLQVPFRKTSLRRDQEPQARNPESITSRGQERAALTRHRTHRSQMTPASAPLRTCRRRWRPGTGACVRQRSLSGAGIPPYARRCHTGTRRG